MPSASSLPRSGSESTSRGKAEFVYRELESSHGRCFCFKCGRARVYNSFLGKAPSYLCTKDIQIASRSREKAGNRRAAAGDVREGSGRESSRSRDSRVLQPLLCYPQEGSGQVEVNTGSEPARAALHSARRLQDGDGRGRPCSSRAGRVGHVVGFHGCLLPCTHSQEVKEVPQVLLVQPSLPVPSVADGSVHVSSNLHQAYQSSEGVCSEEGSVFAPVYRRLVGACQRSTGVEEPHRDGKACGRASGLHHQCEKVRVGTQSGLCLPRVELQVRSGCCCSFRREVEEVAEEHRAFPEQRSSAGQSVAEPDRENGFSGLCGQAGHASCEAVSSRAEGSVVTEDRLSTGCGGHEQRVVEPVGMVERKKKHHAGCAFPQGEASSTGVHGCKYLRLGRLSESGGVCGRQVVSTGEKLAHQLAGDVGCMEHAEGIQRESGREDSTGSVGQLDSGELHTAGRGNEVQAAVGADHGSVQLGRDGGDLSTLSAHRRQTQRSGGLHLERGTSAANGVDVASAGVERSVVLLGQASDRLVRDALQQQDAVVCVPDPRSTGLGSGCSVDRLEQLVCIRIPPNSDHQVSSQEDTGGKVSDHPDSAVLAQASVVPRASGVASGSASAAPRPVVPPEAAEVRCVPPVASETQSSCLEIVKHAMLKKGFSDKVAERVAKPFKESTGGVYESKWRAFCSWCDSRGQDPCKATVSLIAEFLNHLHENKKLSVSTIGGYRTAIGKVLKVTQEIDIGHDEFLSSLIRNFERDSVKKQSLVLWSLPLVLKVLSGSPFEPLHVADMKYVTLKTVFLLALATGARRSELHALMSDDVQFQEATGSLVLHTDVRFLAKTELVDRGGQVCEPIVVRALTRLVGPQDEERVLCPVRAVRHYLRKTKELRGDRKRLFIAFKKGHKGDIVKNTISGWLKKVVILCYELSSKDVRDFHGVKAHQVRALSASWALHKNCSMDKILAACSWKSHTTFTSYYLKDMTLERDGMRQLGPLVVAKQVV